MSRLVGYFCSDDTLTHTVLEEVGDQLRLGDGTEKIGRGFGWVREGRTLLRKQPPQGAQGGELGNIVSDIPARELVAYECDPDSEAVDTLDLQPFSFRTWVFAQDGGDLKSLEEDREEILEEIPDHIRRNIEGETTEELCFHFFLDELHDRGGFGLSQSHPEECVDALVAAARRIEERLERDKSQDGVFTTDMVTISERLLMAVAGSESVYYRKFEGIEEEPEQTALTSSRSQTEEHPRFRAVLLTNGLQVDDGNWEQLPPRHVMWVNTDWEVRTRPLN